jgi:uncharacterized protein (UPF0276 family)
MKEQYPFLGLGMSASATEAEAIARARVKGEASPLPPLDLLNVGVSTMSPPPRGLGALLKQASLECVAHLEEVNLVGELDEPRLRRVLELCEEVDPRWIQEDLGLWVWRGGALGDQMIAPILDQDSLDQATRNIGRILELSRFPFLAENPPFYCAVGDLDLLTFMARLADRTGCGLLLDIGHLIGYCTCTGRDALDYVSEWSAFDKVVEIHLAGYTMVQTGGGALWEDAHQVAIQPLALEVLDRALESARNVKAVTIEVEGARLDVLRNNVLRVADRLQPVAAGDA